MFHTFTTVTGVGVHCKAFGQWMLRSALMWVIGSPCHEYCGSMSFYYWSGMVWLIYIHSVHIEQLVSV